MTATSKLLADPAQVALVRDLIVHARKVGAVHTRYSFGNGLGQPMAPVEHTWDLGDQRVALDDGVLIYRCDRQVILRVREVTGAQQVGDLLAAIGVLPQAFSSAYQAGRNATAFIANVETNPDRRCRNCGATTGLVMLHGNPLVLAPQQWECAAGCVDEQSGR